MGKKIGDWREITDQATGRPYYVNDVTQEVTWKAPPGFEVQEFWEEVQDPEGRVYYHNLTSGQTTWNRPDSPNVRALGRKGENPGGPAAPAAPAAAPAEAPPTTQRRTSLLYQKGVLEEINVAQSNPDVVAHPFVTQNSPVAAVQELGGGRGGRGGARGGRGRGGGRGGAVNSRAAQLKNMAGKKYTVTCSGKTMMVLVNPKKMEVTFLQVERGKEKKDIIHFDKISVITTDNIKLKLTGNIQPPFKKELKFLTPEKGAEFIAIVCPRVELKKADHLFSTSKDAPENWEDDPRIQQLEKQKQEAIKDQDYKAQAMIIKQIEAIKSGKTELPQKTKGGGFKRFARGLVSKKKMRFQQEGFDLDLSYITPKLIAMGFPSEGTEGIFRNPMEEVQKFFKSKHQGKFKIYNLCSERKYEHEKFEAGGLGGKVAEYPFDDHNPPPFNLLIPICKDIDAFLKQGRDNVVAIHCKAGKGRTGTVIAAYLVYSQSANSSQDALNFFAENRTKNAKGVTIPSQARSVHYLDAYIRHMARNNPGKPISDFPPVDAVPLKLVNIILHTVPMLVDGGCTPYFEIFTVDGQKVFDYKQVTGNKMPGYYDKKTTKISIPLVAIVEGDIKFLFKDAGKDKNKKDKMFHFWLNTYFVQHFDQGHVYLEKMQVDKAAGDTKCKKFKKDFGVELFFESPSAQEVAQVREALKKQAQLAKTTAQEKSKQELKEGVVLLEKDMPDDTKVEEMFEKYMIRSRFPKLEQKASRKLSPQVKWQLMCQNSKIGGPAATLHLAKADDDDEAKEEADYYSDEEKDDFDKEDFEKEEEADDDPWWLEALYDFDMEPDGEFQYLNFKQGDKILVVLQDSEEWWLGEVQGKPGVQGYFPPTYTKNAE